MEPSCSDVCEIVHDRLLMLGFDIDPSEEDHTDIIEALSKVKFVREDDERKWCMWTLSMADIEIVARNHNLSLIGRNIDGIARSVQKAFEWGMNDVWEEAIFSAIENNKVEWGFEIEQVSMMNRSEVNIDDPHDYYVIVEYKGSVLVSSPNIEDSFPVEFSLTSYEGSDRDDEVIINPEIPDNFTRLDWDTLVEMLKDFIKVSNWESPFEDRK